MYIPTCAAIKIAFSSSVDPFFCFRIRSRYLDSVCHADVRKINWNKPPPYRVTCFVLTRVSQMKTLNIFYLLPWKVWCADPWLISRCAAISFTVTRQFSFVIWYDMIWYIFSCNWVDTRWQQYSSHLHTNSTPNTKNGTYITITKLNTHNNKNLTNLWSAGRAPSLRVIPWHLPYNWGKSTEKPQLG